MVGIFADNDRERFEENEISNKNKWTISYRDWFWKSL